MWAFDFWEFILSFLFITFFFFFFVLYVIETTHTYWEGIQLFFIFFIHLKVKSLYMICSLTLELFWTRVDCSKWKIMRVLYLLDPEDRPIDEFYWLSNRCVFVLAQTFIYVPKMMKIVGSVALSIQFIKSNVCKFDWRVQTEIGHCPISPSSKFTKKLVWVGMI